MYLDRSKITVNGKTYHRVLLRQSYRQDGSADSDESGHLFQSISDTVPGLSDSCRSEATL